MVLYGNLKILIMITENTTIREFLQTLGTECLREQLNPNIHVFMLFSDCFLTCLINFLPLHSQTIRQSKS